MDTETTGLNLKQDQLLSIAGIPASNYRMQLAGSLDFLLDQDGWSGRQSVLIHGILPGTRRVTQTLASVLPQLLDGLQNRIIVGHHIRFDIAMLNQQMKQLTGGTLKNEWLDTASLARRLPPFRGKPAALPITLDDLCAVYGLRPNGRHTAAGDSFLTAQIFFRQLKALEQQGACDKQELLRKPLKIHRH
jgi:DNA polymerase-3 subunit epsilon